MSLLKALIRRFPQLLRHFHTLSPSNVEAYSETGDSKFHSPLLSSQPTLVTPELVYSETNEQPNVAEQAISIAGRECQ